MSSLAELNEMVEQWDRQDDVRRIGSRSRTIAEDFALERPLLMQLPEEPFENGRLFTPRVDRYGQIPVRANRYSIPIRLIGKRVRVILHTSAQRSRPGARPPRGRQPPRGPPPSTHSPRSPGPRPNTLRTTSTPRPHRSR
ncbi:hypothetical protein [Streptomyces sp. NPDC055912]|uniref:Mu transposase domain-containing protein n=1 Tax=unclassified Streptomyces TaxID=2593676 RepID=UPI0035E1B29E